MSESSPLRSDAPSAQEIVLPADVELLRRAALYYRRKVTRGGVPRWSAVGCLFGLGSTYSWHLCERLGVDPEEMVRSS